MVCLVSLITLYYQWENWRSARELAVVRLRMVERLGTDDPLALMPPKVADEDNYFANPVLESWLRVTQPERGQMQYTAPSNALLPPGFIQPEIVDSADGEIDRLDLDAWMKKRGGQGSEAAAAVLARELGDGNGLLPKLAEGLNKPFSVMKPGPREALEAAGDDPCIAVIPNFHGLNDFQRQLGLHLRSAALAEDTAKTVSTALIMLRVSEGTARGGLTGCLVPLALHETSFDALHEALSHPAWTPETLGRLQVRLGQFDDLQQYQSAHGQEILGTFSMLVYLRNHRPELHEVIRHRSTKPWLWQRLAEDIFDWVVVLGPIGWHDANIAFYTDCMLEQLGPPGAKAWLTGTARGQAVRLRSRSENSWPNPRRFLAGIAIPNVGSLAEVAAKTLFRRRCLIIACALEKHRLKQGGFPASLEAVKEDLKLYTITDPARPSMPLGYRLETKGYLLWSAGPDAKDDGGTRDKDKPWREHDWLWRMQREP
ncbi:hypothetical protein [Prosthecobacter sp.]|uniref:hypothetical protein n=1 Tax=Prosthecobacter sp. TaxID=1965333 RepID=UPI0037844CDE